MAAGRTVSPSANPSAAATAQHTAAMNRYLNIILPSPAPSERRQPIIARSSSIMRVIVVMTTSAATRMKNTGNTAAMTDTFSQ